MSVHAPPQSLALEHVFDYDVVLRPPVVIGSAQHGTRLFYEVGGGRLEGPGVTGEVLSGGGDWALVRADGWTEVDVRGQCRTEDGAVLYMTYRGLIEPAPAVAAALRAGSETGFEDHYWRVSIQVETASSRYAWLTRSALVGRGRVSAGRGVCYEVFRVR
jgi:Protein of unknown function (DUF3237)